MAMKDIEGLDKVLKNLNKEIGKIEGRSKQGMIAGGIIVKNKSLPITPVDTGNLRSSNYVLWRGGSESKPAFKSKEAAKMAQEHGAAMSASASAIGDLEVEIGFTAYYAAKVHETLRHYRQGAWKFLEQAIKISASEILDEIRERATIK